MHPSQTLTEEEVLKYALRKEEYVGVLGKEYAEKDQEWRLAMDLTKLNSDVLLQIPTQLSFGAKLYKCSTGDYTFIAKRFLCANLWLRLRA